MAEASLDGVAATAEQVAADQREVARRVRIMQRRRERGWTWTEIAERERLSDLVELLRDSWRMLASATTVITAVLATALSSEGHTRRQISRHLGVTHQRVSAVLGRGGNPSTPS